MVPASRRKAVVATRWRISEGEERKNDTHASTTDPDVRLIEKSRGDEAKRCFIGHALMENRDGLAVFARPGEKSVPLLPKNSRNDPRIPGSGKRSGNANPGKRWGSIEEFLCGHKNSISEIYSPGRSISASWLKRTAIRVHCAGFSQRLNDSRRRYWQSILPISLHHELININRG